MKRRMFCALLVLTMLLSACSPSAERESSPGTSDKPAQETASSPVSEPTDEMTDEPTPEATLLGGVIASGECGKKVTWTLNSSGMIIISGTGEMENYGGLGTAFPSWYELRDMINSAVIESGVTSIGRYAFRDCGNLASVTISDGVTSIWEYSLAGCNSLTSVVIPASIAGIAVGAFDECVGLTDVYYSGGEAQWNQIIILSDNTPLLNATIHYNS